MLTVAMVWKTGGDYSQSYVYHLARGVRRHLPEAKILCLTDRPDQLLGPLLPDQMEVRPLLYDWPGWWSKMELFYLAGPILYLDLDTVVVGNLAGLGSAVESLSISQLLMLRGFYRNDECSGVMGWSGDHSAMFWAFKAVAENAVFLQRRSTAEMVVGPKRYRGDQDWIRTQNPSVVMAQDVAHGIVSYKEGIRKTNRGVPSPGTSLVVFHGQPRPHEVSDKWLLDAWSPEVNP